MEKGKKEKRRKRGKRKKGKGKKKKRREKGEKERRRKGEKEKKVEKGKKEKKEKRKKKEKKKKGKKEKRREGKKEKKKRKKGKKERRKKGEKEKGKERRKKREKKKLICDTIDSGRPTGVIPTCSQISNNNLQSNFPTATSPSAHVQVWTTDFRSGFAIFVTSLHSRPTSNLSHRLPVSSKVNCVSSDNVQGRNCGVSDLVWTFNQLSFLLFFPHHLAALPVLRGTVHKFGPFFAHINPGLEPLLQDTGYFRREFVQLAHVFQRNPFGNQRE